MAWITWLLKLKFVQWSVVTAHAWGTVGFPVFLNFTSAKILIFYVLGIVFIIKWWWWWTEQWSSRLPWHLVSPVNWAKGVLAFFLLHPSSVTRCSGQTQENEEHPPNLPGGGSHLKNGRFHCWNQHNVFSHTWGLSGVLWPSTWDFGDSAGF